MIFSAAILLASCGNKNNSNPDNTAANPEQSTPKAEMTPQHPEPYFNGSGEGVTVAMASAPDGTFPVKMTLADVAYEGKLSKEGLAGTGGPNVKSGEAKFSGVLESAGSGQSATLSIVAGDCAVAGSDTKSHSFVITLGEKSSKGCGQYAE